MRYHSHIKKPSLLKQFLQQYLESVRVDLKQSGSFLLIGHEHGHFRLLAWRAPPTSTSESPEG